MADLEEKNEEEEMKGEGGFGREEKVVETLLGKRAEEVGADYEEEEEEEEEEDDEILAQGRKTEKRAGKFKKLSQILSKEAIKAIKENPEKMKEIIDGLSSMSKSYEQGEGMEILKSRSKSAELSK